MGVERGMDQASTAEELERKILEGLDSSSREMTQADWRQLETTLRRKLATRRKDRWRDDHSDPRRALSRRRMNASFRA